VEKTPDTHLSKGKVVVHPSKIDFPNCFAIPFPPSLSLSVLSSWLLIIQVLIAMNSLIGLTSYEFKETPDTETTVLSVWFFCFFISTR